MVYECVLNIYQIFYSKNKSDIELENAKLQFIKKYREAVFLFGESSDVYKVLSEFKADIIFIYILKIGFKIKNTLRKSVWLGLKQEGR